MMHDMIMSDGMMWGMGLLLAPRRHSPHLGIAALAKYVFFP